jgi:hypothetical protein
VGETASCTLQPPSRPRARTIFSAQRRSDWTSGSGSVWIGATTIESPVCTPIGSRFSIPQMAIVVSAASRRTSNSISFQPSRLRSTSTWWMGLVASPVAIRRSASSGVVANPPPPPPRVKAGLMTTGTASSRTKAIPASRSSMTRLSGTGSPIPVMRSRNAPRSSALRTASSGVPSTRTSHRSSTPASASATARLRPVCPPSVGSRASGRCSSMTLVTCSSVSGPMITVPPTSGSVMTVAGFEFTRIVSTPSARSARQAWTPA